jgi:hypothetical protein
MVRQKRENMNDDEAIVHIDFSENYMCKFNREVQSCHFGSANGQVSLHTGVAYVGGTEVISFCSMSDNMSHDPIGIWAHLLPVLEKVVPPAKIKNLPFLSDGPTTQYRNQKHFAMTRELLFGLGYRHVTWNFLEAGHGKGAADGVGGAVKRSADSHVANGGQITDAASLYRCLLTSSSSIELFLIEDESFSEMATKVLKMSTQRIPGTMKIHQLIYKKR